jgi:D-alanyl-D-alanine carboxypeptidase
VKRTPLITSVLVVIGLSIPGAATAATLRPALDPALDAGRRSTAAPAATAAVMRCGQLVWSGASGVMDVSTARPATPAALTAVASTTKTVSAALTLDLIERGKLSLDTRLSKFYPQLPSARRITMRMLLDHTSGLSEYFDDPRINQIIIDEPSHQWTRAEVLSAITKTQFAPGTRYVYTNANYVVLGGVIEKVTHDTIEHAFRTRIAGPLGLKDSTFEYRPSQSALFAHPYVNVNGNLFDAFAPGVGVRADYWGPVWTDGGLASTAPDLARFGDALFEGRLLSPKTIRTMTRPNRFGHGLGVDRKRFAGHTWTGHDGRYGGYESELWYDAKRRITIAVTTDVNASSLTVWKALVAAYDGATPAGRRCAAG